MYNKHDQTSRFSMKYDKKYITDMPMSSVSLKNNTGIMNPSLGKSILITNLKKHSI